MNKKELSLEDIKKPIQKELDLFEQKFKESMQSSVPLLDRITYYIYKRKGKQMRPLFVFFCAKLFGEINDGVYRGAAMVELLHTATLVHDDVVDNSFQRRGFFSINALWKNKIAVIVGDFLLAKGMLLSLSNDDFRVLKIVSDAIKQMSEGELLQIEKARRMDISEEIYYDVIRGKTASLLASCCAIGAATGGAAEEDIEKLRLFGEYIGMAFQIKDDLFDFGDDKIGKPKGLDIKDKKITLPLIYALQDSSSREKREIIHLIRNYSEDKIKVREVIEFVKAKGGIQKSYEKMQEFQDKAGKILSDFPPSPWKESLQNLVSFTVDRNT
jgi:octaprenyl-diphosphate synthase